MKLGEALGKRRNIRKRHRSTWTHGFGEKVLCVNRWEGCVGTWTGNRKINCELLWVWSLWGLFFLTYLSSVDFLSGNAFWFAELPCDPPLLWCVRFWPLWEDIWGNQLKMREDLFWNTVLERHVQSLGPQATCAPRQPWMLPNTFADDTTAMSKG